MEHVTLENRVHPLYYTFRRNPRLFQLYGIDVHVQSKQKVITTAQELRGV